MSEPGIDWAATFSKPGPGGTVNVVHCYDFKRGGGSRGDTCTRCGIREHEHVQPASDTDGQEVPTMSIEPTPYEAAPIPETPTAVDHKCVHLGEWFAGWRAVCSCRKEFTGQSVESVVNTYTLHIVEFTRVARAEAAERQLGEARAENARLWEALEPFANLTDCYCEEWWKEYKRTHGPNCVVDDLTPEIEEARRALSDTRPDAEAPLCGTCGRPRLSPNRRSHDLRYAGSHAFTLEGDDRETIYRRVMAEDAALRERYPEIAKDYDAMRQMVSPRGSLAEFIDRRLDAVAARHNTDQEES